MTRPTRTRLLERFDAFLEEQGMAGQFSPQAVGDLFKVFTAGAAEGARMLIESMDEQVRRHDVFKEVH